MPDRIARSRDVRRFSGGARRTGPVRYLGLAVALLLVAIIGMIVVLVRMALTGPSVPVSTYDFNVQQYQSRLERYPNDIQARIGIAQTYLMANDYDKAKEQLTEALKAEKVRGTPPKYLSIVHYLLGGIYKVKGFKDKAIDEYKKAMNADPTNDQAVFQLALILAETGKTDEAISVFRQLIRMQPIAADGHYQLGLLLAKKGQKQEALKELQLAQRFLPGDKDIAAAIAGLRSGK